MDANTFMGSLVEIATSDEKAKVIQKEEPQLTNFTEKLRQVTTHCKLQAVMFVSREQGNNSHRVNLDLEQYDQWLEGDTSVIGIDRELGNYKFEPVVDFKTGNMVAVIVQLGQSWSFLILSLSPEHKTLESIVEVVNSYDCKEVESETEVY